MTEAPQVLIINCESEEIANRLNTELTELDIAGKVVRRENLDGNAATWIVLASTAITTLPRVLDGVAKVVSALKVRSIKMGDTEIQNPTPADVRAMRKALK